MVARNRLVLFVGLLALAALCARMAPAADSKDAKSADKAAADKGDKAPDAKKPAENLSQSQQQLAEEYKDLEKVLTRMRDLIRQTDPNRAALIEKALKESGDRQVDSDFDKIIELLRKEQLSSAYEKQGKISMDMKAILDLLETENRTKRLQSEKQRIREYLAKLNQIIIEQKGLQGDTARGDDVKSLAAPQGNLAGKTGQLSKNIHENEEQGKGKGKEGGDKKADPQGDGKKSDGKEGDGKKPDGKEGDGKQADGKGKEGDGKKADAKDGGKGQKGDGKPSDGKKGDGKQSDGKRESKGGKQSGKGQKGQGQGQEGQGDSQDQPPPSAQDQPQEDSGNPARKRLDAAQKKMDEAKQKLEEAKKGGALDAQEKALRELEQAKAELEEILRQLREEEMKRLLAMLEARFIKILQIQKEIYDGTVRLDKVPVEQRSHSHEIESGRLGNREAEIIGEVDKALRLLREEGSAVAFPEAIQQVREDMQQIMHRLAQAKTEILTQTIEIDVIKALEDIIDALKKERKKLDDKKKPKPGPSKDGQPQDPPLIDQLAELKMIKAMQLRLNRRNERYVKLIQGEQADKQDVLDALAELAKQEGRIHRVTRDVELGKNQ